MSNGEAMMETENGENSTPTSSTMLRVPVSDVLVHPLVLMNMSEHTTRMRLQNEGQDPPRVFGVLLGKQNGTTAEIVNCFELKPVSEEALDSDTPLDEEFMRTRTAQFIEVFSDLHVLGFYSCNADSFEADGIDVNASRQVRPFHESPLLLKLSTTISTAEMNKVPMLIYHLFNEAKDDRKEDNSISWPTMNWALKCDDAEQIGVEHIARISTDANSDQLSSKGKHLKAQINAVEMLMARMRLIVQYLKDVGAGELPKNPEILVELKKLCERIRLLIAAERDDRGKQQIVDYKTASVLCSVTELAGMLGDLIQKTNIIASERGSGMSMSLRSGLPHGFGKVMLRTPLQSLVRRLSTEKRVGLFGYDALRSPVGFKLLNKQVRERCDRLYKEIVSGSNKNRPAVYLFDDMSNEICCVADLAECTRVLHTDPAFAEHAEESMRDFTELVETLNTSQELYKALQASIKTQANRLDDVDRRVIDLFLADFEKSGIQLEDDSQRREFVQLSSSIFDASSVFMNNINTIPKLSLLEKHRYRSCDSPHPMTADGKMREWAYNKFYEFSNDQEGCLRFLIGCRDRIAKLTGYESFAHRAQDNMLLQDFDSAYQFLHELIKNTQPAAEAELAQLEAELRKEDRSASHVAEWDILYLMSKLRSKSYPAADVMQYFSLGSVMRGFEEIVRNLYGMEFKMSYPDTGEIWRGNTQRIDVYRKSEFLGTIYLDISAHAMKAIGDSHFTVRCSKLLESGEHQTPIAVLSLSFANGQHASGLNDLFMSTYEAQNFFHEMGHAMHSMLGRTRFQHTAGTRCPTDMAEIPSNLMECFFKSSKIVTTVFKNRLGETMSESDAQVLVSSRSMFHSLETIQQAVLCLLDLELHGPAAKSIIDGTCTSSDVLSSIWKRALPTLKRNPNSAYAHRFGHLIQYASKYYAYQVAQSAAELIWDTQFESNPFCPEAGERWAHVQSFGGELPSHKLLEMAIGYAPTSAQLTELSLMLCFVTVGTTKFDKLIETVLSEECLQKLSSIGVDQMRIQYGAGRLPPEREQSENEGAVFTTNNIQIECYRFKPSLREDMKAADLIIGHAGAGTCLEVIQMGKPFIVIINELLMDNHQCELAEQLGIMECLLYTVCRDLAETLTHPSLFRLKKYPSGNPKAITDFIKSRLGFL